MTCNHSTYKITNDNDKSTRLIDLANGIGDRITNIMFAHKSIHKGTWKSPDGLFVNQIDQLLVNEKFENSIKDIRTYKIKKMIMISITS